MWKPLYIFEGGKKMTAAELAGAINSYSLMGDIYTEEDMEQLIREGWLTWKNGEWTLWYDEMG